MKIDLTNYTTFGNLLQKLCYQKGVTMREASKNLNISASYICDMQKGNRRPPQDEILYRVFKYFDIDEFQQLELLDLIYLEKQELTKENAKFLTKNKNAAKLIKQISKIKNFDELAKNNPDLLEKLQSAIDEFTLVNIEQTRTNTK